MKQTMRFTIAVFCMLCTAYMARSAAPGGLSGPDTVCVGSTANYSVVPAASIHYLWSVTPQGNITSPVTPYPGVTIMWGATGAATVTVEEIDSVGAVVGTLTLPVYIEPLPAPVITSNLVVGCSTLDDSTDANKGSSQHILSDSNGCVQVCQGSVVTYKSTGSPGDIYGWTIVGGTILAVGGDSCMVQWGAPGAGSVSVNDTSRFGCVGSKSVCITIIAKPKAHFYAMPDSTSDTVTICLNNTVVFVDNSVAVSGSPILNWFWEFGDGTYFSSSSSTTQTHEYTTPGVDTARLIVKNACGCTDTFTMIVIVTNTQGVTIVCPHVVCQNDTASYSLSPAPPCSSYNWTVKGGVITASHDSNITVLWNNVDSTGFGYVSFDATPCSIACPGITVVKVPVVQQIGYISGSKTDCDNSQYLYTLPEWPSTDFVWTISGTTSATLSHDDQNNHIVINTAGPGIIYLRCNYTNTLLGCGGVAYDTITVLPAQAISGPAEVCLNTAGVYTVAGLNTIWTLTNPSGYSLPGVTTTTYTTPDLTTVGTWVLNVTPAAGVLYCPIAPFLINVLPLPPKPDSLLGPDTTCYGIPTMYTAKNAIPGDIFAWGAVTGTCNAAEGDNSEITFTGAGPDTVELWRETSSSPHCNSDTLRMVVYPPYVHLNITGPDTVCPSSITQYNSGYDAGETYDWKVYNTTMGSVQVDGLSSANILWNNTPGPAIVVLTVVKCTQTYHDTFKVYVRSLPPLSITISPNPVCRGIAFNASVSGAGGGSVSWNWGDGTTGSGAATTHTFHDLVGTIFVHQVAVTVTNPYGCTETETDTMSVSELPAPVAYISPTGPFESCTHPVGYPVNATLEIGFEPTSTLIWENVATGFITSCPSPFPCNPLSINAFGSYYAIAIGNNGCVDTSNIVSFDSVCGGGGGGGSCVLYPAGSASIDSTSVGCGTVFLRGTYTGSPLTAIAWSWSPLPSGATLISSTNTTLECSFTTAGLYTFYYSVTLVDTAGDTCTVQGSANVVVPYIAGMGHSVSCVGSNYVVTLYDHSNYYPGYAPTGFSWYINGVYQTFTSGSPWVVTPPLAGGHGYTLGCWEHYPPGDSCWASDTVYLDTLPVAGFTFARLKTCAVDASVQFTNTSVPGSGLSYLWSFGDGAGNSEENPYRVYATPNFWPVTLTVTNEYGCTSTISKPVQVVAMDLGGTLSGPTIACSGTPVQLTYLKNAGTNFPNDYYWMEGTDTLYMGTVNTTYVYSSGSYWVIGTDTFGCFFPTTDLVLNVIKVPPAVISGSHYACLNSPYTLNGWVGSDPNVSYKWFKNHVPDGTGSSVTDPAAYVTAVPDTFMLVVFIAMGTDTCSDTSSIFLVSVYPPPAIPYITMPVVISCNSYTFQLTATGPAYGTYNWSNGMSGQTIDVTPAGGPYTVWYTDTFGCSSSASTFIPRDPKTYLWTFPSGCFTFCDTSMHLRYITGPMYEPFYPWTYQDAPIGPILKQGYGYVDTFSIPGAGDYDLVLNNGYCADTSAQMDITVIPCGNIKPNCKCITSKLTGFIPKCLQPPCACSWDIALCTTNTCDERLNAVITVSGGTVTPGGLVISPGTYCDTFVYHPTGAFYGGWVYFTISWSDASGNYECPDSVYLPECGSGSREGQQGLAQQPGSVLLNLVPNPAQNTVRVDFATSSASGTEIDVYDITGRLINSYQPAEAEGSWYVDLSNYPAGIFVVALKENGRLMKQGRLSVVR